MQEFLAVVAVYFVLSFAGMAVLWTIAAKKQLVQAPGFFFWMRSAGQRLDIAEELTLNEEGIVSGWSNLSKPRVAVAMSFSLNLRSTSKLSRGEKYRRDNNPNQSAESAGMACIS